MTCLTKRKKGASSPRGQMRGLEGVGVATSHGTIMMILVRFVPWGVDFGSMVQGSDNWDNASSSDSVRLSLMS